MGPQSLVACRRVCDFLTHRNSGFLSETVSRSGGCFTADPKSSSTPLLLGETHNKAEEIFCRNASRGRGLLSRFRQHVLNIKRKRKRWICYVIVCFVYTQFIVMIHCPQCNSPHLFVLCPHTSLATIGFAMHMRSQMDV
jgi:hypothetical protein